MRQSVGKMKLVVAIFALIACSGVWGSNPPLDKAWDTGAKEIDAATTEVLVSGTNLKDEFIQAIDTYLVALDTEIDQQIAFGALDFSISTGQIILDMKGKVILANQGFAGPTEFDSDLKHLTEKIDEIVAIVRVGEKSLSRRAKFPKRIESLAEIFRRFYLKAASQRVATATPRYTMDQLFFGLQKTVLERDFNILDDWQITTFKSGYSNVQVESDGMEKKHRLGNLWTNVKQLQSDVKEITASDAVIQKFSTAAIFKEYNRAREDLMTIDVDKKIQADQA